MDIKAGLCSGKDFWRFKSVERLGVPEVMVSDGPHGLRKQAEGGDHLGLNDSIDATCFPTSVGLAASFDREIAAEQGDALGAEAAAENLAVLLGPAINIKTGYKHKTQSLVRQELRIYVRRPVSDGRTCRGVHKRRAGSRSRRQRQTLCRQQPGRQAHDDFCRSRRKDDEGNLPARIRNRSQS